MNEEKNYILTLDDNKKYVLIDSLSFNKKTYAYLTELNDFTKYKICEIIDDEAIEIQDQNLLGQLMLEFAKLHQNN